VCLNEFPFAGAAKPNVNRIVRGRYIAKFSLFIHNHVDTNLGVDRLPLTRITYSKEQT